MPWDLTFDNSFVENWDSLKAFQDEIGYVLKGLEKAPDFDPGDEYLLERNEDEDYFACQHVRGWCGYRVGWYFEYSENLDGLAINNTIKDIVIFILPPERGPEDLYISILPKR